mmetsp:Transcript_23901/g.51247  ORF Transcript_23901/g.51247 Transcript_23901/m.51247 type:complete len:311 (-) Transcript_23901:535-1467(-)
MDCGVLVDLGPADVDVLRGHADRQGRRAGHAQRLLEHGVQVLVGLELLGAREAAAIARPQQLVDLVNQSRLHVLVLGQHVEAEAQRARRRLVAGQQESEALRRNFRPRQHLAGLSVVGLEKELQEPVPNLLIPPLAAAAAVRARWRRRETFRAHLARRLRSHLLLGQLVHFIAEPGEVALGPEGLLHPLRWVGVGEPLDQGHGEGGQEHRHEDVRVGGSEDARVLEDGLGRGHALPALAARLPSDAVEAHPEDGGPDHVEGHVPEGRGDVHALAAVRCHRQPLRKLIGRLAHQGSKGRHGLHAVENGVRR